MSAWIAGVKLAIGDYIGFVDGDDWVNDNMYESMVYTAKQYKAEIVTCAFLKDYGTYVEEVPVFIEEGIYYGEKLYKQLYTMLINVGYGNYRGIGASRCNKLIKRELLINNLKYCDCRISYGEDLNITVPVALDAKRIYVMKNSFFYHYRQNPSSITNSPSYKEKFWETCLVLNDNLRRVVKEKGYEKLLKQLDMDLVYMAWTSLLNECRNNDHISNIYRNMKQITNNDHVKRGFLYLNYKKMPLKEKIVLRLIKSKRVSLLYFIYKTTNHSILRKRGKLTG